MTTKTDNARGALDVKLQLRKDVLRLVNPANVFDGFCGTGKMWRSVWTEASSYMGCDTREWSPDDPSPRFVADTHLVLRCAELKRWNVFDFDAYGCPWTAMLILAARRKWERGERGAVTLTDGTSMRIRFGSMSGAIAQLLGIARDGHARSDQNSAALAPMLLQRWCAISNVAPVAQWTATGNGSGRGAAKMRYTGLVFDGKG